jgi:hypothetical protein
VESEEGLDHDSAMALMQDGGALDGSLGMPTDKANGQAMTVFNAKAKSKAKAKSNASPMTSNGQAMEVQSFTREATTTTTTSSNNQQQSTEQTKL